MSDEFPRIVSLPTSLELSEFPSEADETEAPAAKPIAAAPEPHTLVPARELHGVSSGPATVTEFPVQATKPQPPASPAVVASPITLLELLERQGGMDWRRAVALVHEICEQLKHHASHPPMLLDARNILVTHEGEVRLLPGQTGGDPLVIQLGRLLRTMLMGNEAPPELRLLLAQATFELPIFESVEDVDRALQQLERFEEATGKPAFVRPVAPPETPEGAAESLSGSAAPVRPILPPTHAPRPGRRRTPPLTALIQTYFSRIAASLIVIAVIGAVLLTRPNVLWPSASSPPPARSSIIAPGQPAGPPLTARETPPVRSDAPRTVPLAPAPSATWSTPPPAAASHGARAGTARVDRSARRDPPASAGPPSTAATSGTSASLRESERRATALMAQGQTVEAAMAFDALVLSNPLYEPKSTELTPESMTAFRSSQKLLLPVIGQRTYDRARAALASGDPERALALGKDAARILERPLADATPQLKDQVRDLLESATAAKAAVDDIVYTEADAGVVPPRQLSRQFPATSPIGVPPHRVGTLEMVIARDGTVEFIKLHTPLNRYHERMIVSAAKAWLYRPATRNGRPVKYRITVKVNLPESGTDY